MGFSMSSDRAGLGAPVRRRTQLRYCGKLLISLASRSIAVHCAGSSMSEYPSADLNPIPVTSPPVGQGITDGIPGITTTYIVVLCIIYIDYMSFFSRRR